MHILLLAGEYPPHIFGGGGTFMYYLSRELAKRGHKVYVVALAFSERYTDNLCRNITVERINDKLVIIRVSISRYLYPRHKLFQLCSKDIVERLLEKANIVHLNTGLYYPFIRDVIQKSKKPAVVTIHGEPSIVNKISLFTPSGTVKDKIYHATFLLDGVMSLKYEASELYPVFVSKHLVRSVSSYIPLTDYKVIYNGVDFDYINMELKQNISSRYINIIQNYLRREFKILTYPARLYPSKNNVFLLYATKKLLKRGHKVITILAGEGPLKIKLKNLSEHLRIGRYIIMTGRLPYEDVLKILCVTHVVPFPSLYEACPLAVIEALYIGKPIVAFDLPYISELMDMGVEGIYVARNPLHFVEVVDTLLSQDDTIDENQLNSRTRKRIIELFSVETMVDQYEQLYFDLIK